MADDAGAVGQGAAPEDGGDAQAQAHEDLVVGIEDVKQAVDAMKVAVGTPTPAAPAATGQCCDTYPAEALNTALGMPVDPAILWKQASEAELSGARQLNQKAAEARIELLRKSAWATAPEMVLLEACASGERTNLAKKMLEVKAGTTTTDDLRRTAEKDLMNERATIAKVGRETLQEGLAQMKVWTRMAALGKVLLVASTIFSAVMIVRVLKWASESKLDGTETPIIIFILAIFAISPAVLLLLERPLEGLDKFTPGGSTGGDSGSGGGSDAGGGEGGTAAASGGSGGS